MYHYKFKRTHKCMNDVRFMYSSALLNQILFLYLVDAVNVFFKMYFTRYICTSSVFRNESYEEEGLSRFKV